MELFKEYEGYCALHEYDAIDESGFVELWKDCFPKVLIREYKAVSGKCRVCAALSILRSSFRDSKRRLETTCLHAFHRSTYMGERKSYYTRRRDALDNPSEFCSIITDGMAQSHTILPWLKRLNSSSHTIDQHLQGTIQHGQWTNIYRHYTIMIVPCAIVIICIRTFGNIGGGANLAIHVILLDLLDRYERDGSLPQTLYLRGDGGSENNNKTLLGICELLVARKLVKALFFERLPVGHTHEDIDGVFSRIWIRMRDLGVITPQDYRRLVTGVFAAKAGDTNEAKAKMKFVDLYCIPDYKSFMNPHIDRNFGKVFKEQWTQLCFRFRSVEVDKDFPTGVEMHYRAYAQDEVFEIVDSERWECGKGARKCYVKWYPEGKGMYLLRSFPRGEVQAAPFIPGSRAAVEAAVKGILAEHGKYADTTDR